MKKTFLFVLMLACSLAVNAQTANISLSEDSAQFKYSLLVGGQSFGRSEFGFGLLYNADEDYVIETGLHVVDEAGSSAPGLKIGVGGKLYGASLPGQEIMALGLGGMLRFTIPKNERFALALEGYYAPEIVTFLDAQNFWEFAIRAEYEILQQAAAFLEFRTFETKLDSGDEGAIDEGARLGIRIDF